MDMSDQAVVVFITAGSEVEAARIAQGLVEKRVAACVNTVSGVRSLYWWQGKMESAQELLLVVKTRSSLVPMVTDVVKRLHSYTVPEVIALPIVGGNQQYLDWLLAETKTGTD